MVSSVMFKSEKDTWETPENICSSIEKLYPDGYLDPAPPVEINEYMPLAYYESDIDYLGVGWCARNVYMNPPYGRVIGKWTTKFEQEFQDGNFENGIALVPGRLGAKWFQRFTRNSSCWCALDGRLKFVDAENSAPFPSVLVLYTTSLNFLNDFVDEFYEKGLFWQSI